MELREKLAIIQEAITTLSHNERQVMLLIIAGDSNELIASKTGLSPGNVRTITSRARKYLKEYLLKKLK